MSAKNPPIIVSNANKKDERKKAHIPAPKIEKVAEIPEEDDTTPRLPKTMRQLIGNCNPLVDLDLITHERKASDLDAKRKREEKRIMSSWVYLSSQGVQFPHGISLDETVDTIRHHFVKYLYSAEFFKQIVTRFFRAVKTIQNFFRAAKDLKEDKINTLYRYWCEKEAVVRDHMKKRIQRYKRANPFSHVIQSNQTMWRDYLQSRTPKNLKLRTIKELYEERKRNWCADWKEYSKVKSRLEILQRKEDKLLLESAGKLTPEIERIQSQKMTLFHAPEPKFRMDLHSISLLELLLRGMEIEERELRSTGRNYYEPETSGEQYPKVSHKQQLQWEKAMMQNYQFERQRKAGLQPAPHETSDAHTYIGLIRSAFLEDTPYYHNPAVLREKEAQKKQMELERHNQYMSEHPEAMHVSTSLVDELAKRPGDSPKRSKGGGGSSFGRDFASVTPKKQMGTLAEMGRRDTAIFSSHTSSPTKLVAPELGINIGGSKDGPSPRSPTSKGSPTAAAEKKEQRVLTMEDLAAAAHGADGDTSGDVLRISLGKGASALLQGLQQHTHTSAEIAALYDLLNEPINQLTGAIVRNPHSDGKAVTHSKLTHYANSPSNDTSKAAHTSTPTPAQLHQQHEPQHGHKPKNLTLSQVQAHLHIRHEGSIIPPSMRISQQSSLAARKPLQSPACSHQVPIPKLPVRCLLHNRAHKFNASHINNNHYNSRFKKQETNNNDDDDNHEDRSSTDDTKLEKLNTAGYRMNEGNPDKDYGFSVTPRFSTQPSHPSYCPPGLGPSHISVNKALTTRQVDVDGSTTQNQCMLTLMKNVVRPTVNVYNNSDSRFERYALHQKLVMQDAQRTIQDKKKEQQQPKNSGTLQRKAKQDDTKDTPEKRQDGTSQQHTITVTTTNNNNNSNNGNSPKKGDVTTTNIANPWVRHQDTVEEPSQCDSLDTILERLVAGKSNSWQLLYGLQAHQKHVEYEKAQGLMKLLNPDANDVMQSSYQWPTGHNDNDKGAHTKESAKVANNNNSEFVERHQKLVQRWKQGVGNNSYLHKQKGKHNRNVMFGLNKYIPLNANNRKETATTGEKDFMFQCSSVPADVQLMKPSGAAQLLTQVQHKQTELLEKAGVSLRDAARVLAEC